jgi:hypothetical protein
MQRGFVITFKASRNSARERSCVSVMSAKADTERSASRSWAARGSAAGPGESAGRDQRDNRRSREQTHVILDLSRTFNFGMDERFSEVCLRHGAAGFRDAGRTLTLWRGFWRPARPSPSAAKALLLAAVDHRAQPRGANKCRSSVLASHNANGGGDSCDPE